MENELNQTKSKIKKELADFLGIETEDIEDESILAEDFHMKPTDLTDFVVSLESKGYETSKIDLTQIETFSDLIDAINELI